MNLLVFPSDNVDEERFYLLNRVGVEIVPASSSLSHLFLGKTVNFLPYVTDKVFVQAFTRLVVEKNITHFYTEHAGVWGVIDSLLKQSDELQFELVADFPFDSTWQEFEKYSLWADAVNNSESLLGGTRLDKDSLASLCQRYNQIPGQSDNVKLEALVNLATSIPEGDWVEIGALYGRSSYALGVLAGYNNSKLICIDPWDALKVRPQQGKASILDSQSDLIDNTKIFNVFRSSIALLSNTSYIRSLSEDALPRYLTSDFDGRSVTINKSISFLHIDGNHHYDEVSKDIALWEPHVCVGGWIAVDDYLWAFGDGPKKAGDNLLRTGRFDEAFVSGDTLYMRKAF
ncbi:MAG: class I SAM-dependent methyltransferase [Neptuniibacter sp.]